MKTTKRLLAMLLVLTMLLSNLPVAVLAEELTEPAVEETIAQTAVEETPAVITEESEETEETIAEETSAQEPPVEEPPAEETPAEEPEKDTVVEEVSNEAKNASSGMPLIGFYSSGSASLSNRLTEYELVNSTLADNSFYYYFYKWHVDGTSTTDYFEPVGEPYFSNNDYVEVDKESTYRWKINLTEACIDQLEEWGEDSYIILTLYQDFAVYWTDSNGVQQVTEDTAATQITLMLEDNTSTTITPIIEGAYISFDWLNNDGNGFYAAENADACYNTDLGLMPGQEMNLIFYLNYYEMEGAETMAKKPVHVRLDGEGSMNFQLISDEAAPNASYSEYYYRVTTDTWDQHLDIVTELEDGTTIGGARIHTSRFEMCAYTSMDMSNETCVPVTYVTDVSEGAAFELYVGLDSDWTAESFVVDYGGEHITLEDTANANIKRVVLTDEGWNALRNDWHVYVGVAGVHNGEKRAFANFSIAPDYSTLPHDPYITICYLEDWGEGLFEGEDHYDGMGPLPGEVNHAIFYLNEWNDADQCYYQRPVHVRSGKGSIHVEDVKEAILAGQENSEYFCTISVDNWDEEVEVYCELEDGTRISFWGWTGRPEQGFYTTPEMSNETWYGHRPFEIDPFETNTIYFGLNSDWATIQELWIEDWAADYVDVRRVNEHVYSITLTDTGLDQNMGQYLLGIPVCLNIVDNNDPNHVEFRQTNIDFSRMELQSSAWLNLDKGYYELFRKGNQQMWNHGFATGEYNEWGEIWANELVDALPEGLSYNYTANKLTMNNYHGSELSVGYGWYDENDGMFYQNLPTDDLIIELIGENSLVSERDIALNIYDGLNVTFAGNGSLYIKTTNSVDNVDMEGHPYSSPAMNVDGTDIVFKDDVEVTIEIAGEALEGCWDENGYIGSRPAHLLAFNSPGENGADIYLQDDATLTTVVPEGARANGPTLDENDKNVLWGDRNPGGYSGMVGFNSLNISGNATLNTQGIGLAWNPDNGDASYYNQTGGTVNIDSLGYNLCNEYYNEETGENEVWEGIYYVGLDTGSGCIVNISGGQLNIDVAANTDGENFEFEALSIMGGELNISGGQVNLNANGVGKAMWIGGWFDDRTQKLSSSTMNFSGGELNFNLDDYADAMWLTSDSRANFTGGVINAENGSFRLRGATTFDGTIVNADNGFLEIDNESTINSGEINMLDGYNMVEFNGMIEMNGGTINLAMADVYANNGFHFNGGEINIDNTRETDHGWPAFNVNTYFAMTGDAKLNIINALAGPAMRVEGTFHQMGGIVNIAHNNTIAMPENEEEEPFTVEAVHLVSFVNDEGQEIKGTIMLNDGEFNIESINNETILGLNMDGNTVLFVGGMENGQAPELTMVNADVEGHGIMDLKQNAVVTMKQGTLNLFGDSEIIMDAGAAFTMNVSKKHSDDWDIAFLTGDHSNVTIGDATLTITTEGYDCAFDVNGNYTQNGGTVTINNTDGDLAMAVKGIAAFNGGTTNLSGIRGYSQVYEPTISENSRFVFNRGAQMYVNAEQVGIEILSAAEINGGSLNINVSGNEFNAYDPDGNLLGRVMQANGILLNGWNYEDSELLINGGTHYINVPESVEGDYFEADTNGIRALQGKLDIQGCRMFIKAIWPIVSNSNDVSDMLTIADGMDVYSLNTGAYLVPMDCTVAFDANGNLTEDLEQASMIRYLRSFAEDNADSNIYTGEGIDSYVLVTPNVAGSRLTWKLVDGILTFGGKGGMYDFSELNSSQWQVLSDFITEVEIDSNVSYVGNYAFNGLKNLSTLTFLGKAPVFGENAFAGVKARVNYPHGEPTWTVDLMQDYGGDLIWELQYEAEEVVGLVTDKDILPAGDKATLTATIFPNIDPSVTVVWSLGDGDKDFVTLKDNGKGVATITAKKNKELRQVTVYATTKEGRTEPLSVTITIVPQVTKVNILSDLDEVITGTTQTLYMSTDGENTMNLHAVNDPDGSVQEWTWKSSNAKAATVDEYGTVTALTAGKTVTITATATDGSKKSANVKIKLVQPMEDVSLPDELVIGSGKSVSLAAEVFPDNTTNKKLNWEILGDGSDYATISSSGKLKAKTLTGGPQQITVRVSAQENASVFAECIVTIYPAVTKVNILHEEEVVTGKTLTLNMDPDGPNTLDLDAVNDPDGSTQEWVWKSSSEKFATVDEEGIVTGLTAGKTVTITATATDGSAKKATVKIKMVQPMQEINLPETAMAAKGKTITLTADIYPSNTTNKKLVWTMENGGDEFATISSSGKLKVKNITEMQTVTVRVTADENPDVYAECEVTLYPAAVTKINILNSDGEILTGTQTVVMSADGENTLDLYAETLTEEAASEVIWSSSNVQFATVDENGTVTVLVPGKTVTITATAIDGSAKKATIKVVGIQPMEDLQLKENLVLDEYSNPFIAAGKSLKLITAVDIFPENATNKKLTWSVSENAYGITVNKTSGVLATKKLTEPVIVEVTAVAQDGYGTELTFEVSVYPATTKVTLHNGGIDVTGKTLTLEEGTTAVFEAVNAPENAVGLYTWKSSDETVATVEDGAVTGLVVGKIVTITATALDGSGKKATVKVKVIEKTETEDTEMTEEERAKAEAEIRHAVSLLIDRNEASLGQVPASSFVSMGMTDADGSQFYQNAGGNSYAGYWDLNAHASNCKEAMEILTKYYDVDASGKLIDFPELTYIYNEGAGHAAIAQSIQMELAKYGIRIKLEVQEWGPFLNTRQEGEYSIARHGWISDYNDPISMLDMWTTYSGNNDAQLGKGDNAAIAIYDLDLTPWGFNVKVKNGTWAETYDVLINVIKNCGTDPVRYELMHLAEDMLMESGCIVPLYYYIDEYMLDNSVKGFGTNPMGLKCFRNTTVNGSGSSISVSLAPIVETLDPALITAVDSATLIEHLFSGLARWAPDATGSYNRIEADCAKELVAPVLNADGTATYTYTLKDGLTWSDGEALTAHDFEFAWKRAASTSLGAAYSYMFEHIKGYPDNLAVTASDDKTLTVTLTSNIPYWNELLAFCAYMPVREDVVADWNWAFSADTYVSNGAYSMEYWDDESLLTMGKNENYWDAANVSMEQINCYTNIDIKTSWESGAIQFVDGEVESIRYLYPSGYHVASSLGTYFVIINANQALLPQ